MKKIFSLMLSVVFICLLLTNAVNAQNSNKIPYPDGYDIKSSGASSTENLGDYKKSPYFSQIDFYNSKNSRSLTILEKFKTYQQTTEWSCGPAAALMVIHHFGNRDFDELTIARMMDSTPSPDDGIPQEGVLYGTTTRGMVKFFKEAGYQVTSSLDTKPPGGYTFNHPEDGKNWILQNLNKNTPIMVVWLDWSGHWQVIIGYDTMGTPTLYDDVVIFADPYDTGDHKQDGYYIYPFLRFFYMWNNPRNQPPGEDVQPWLIATPAK